MFSAAFLNRWCTSPSESGLRSSSTSRLLACCTESKRTEASSKERYMLRSWARSSDASACEWPRGFNRSSSAPFTDACRQ
eukprot:scaffold93099_cov66-Phaeocystis_antarctica.AAC.6